VRGDMGVFAVVGTALMFLTFAAMTAGIASRPDPEDALYNHYLLIPSSVQALSDAASACIGYAVTQALDHSSDPHHNISSVTQSSASSYFDTCMTTAVNRIKSAMSAHGFLPSVTPSLNFSCTGPGGDCSDVNVTGSIDYGYFLDITLAGIRIQKDFNGTLPIQKSATVTPTGTIWVGSPATDSDDRNVYRILVRDDLLGRIEVNGTWPR